MKEGQSEFAFNDPFIDSIVELAGGQTSVSSSKLATMQDASLTFIVPLEGRRAVKLRLWRKPLGFLRLLENLEVSRGFPAARLLGRVL